MEYVKITLTAVALALLLGVFPCAQAQATNSLPIATPVTGEITASNTQSWTFSAIEGEVLSFIARKTSGDLDPQFSITNSRGELILSNDDYAYPDTQDALIEAITMPRTDTYTVTVGGIGGTAGQYSLILLNGFSQIADESNFNGDLSWEAATPNISALTINSSEGQLALAVSGQEALAIAIDPQQADFADFYVTVKVNVTGAQGDWVMGMTLRQQDSDNYDLLNLRSRGEWRFIRRQNGIDTTIRDWTTHPVLANTSGSFMLGVLVDGSGFDFFYNGTLFGRLSDTGLAQPGKIGLAVQTGTALTAQTSAQFDDLIITVPTLVAGQRILPQQITLGPPAVLTRDLQRRGLIPAAGQLSLTVPESFIESSRPGVERVPLARGATYMLMAIGTTVSWEAAANGLTGCGLVLQAQDDTNYILAFVDQSGASGVSRREGETFVPGIYSENTDLAGSQHHLLVIVHSEQLLFYVDGLYSGSMTGTAAAGAIGNAVVNFEPIRTSCRFTDTWVWNWEE